MKEDNLTTEKKATQIGETLETSTHDGVDIATSEILDMNVKPIQKLGLNSARSGQAWANMHNKQHANTASRTKMPKNAPRASFNKSHNTNSR